MMENTENKNYDYITEKDVPVIKDGMSEEDIKKVEDFERRYEAYSLFKLNKVEYLRYKQFMADHKDCRINKETGMSNFGTIGGGTVISFMPTGLGSCISIKCEACGAVANITDVDSW